MARRVLLALLALAPWVLPAGNPGLVDFGVAYYPEAWPEERWDADFDLMAGLGINRAKEGFCNYLEMRK